jgi:UDP-N-acetylmuramate-alanine ligase
VFVDDLRELPALLAAVLQPGDLVLMMGAGSIGRVATDLPRLLEGLDG